MQSFSECGITIGFGKPASYSGQKRIAVQLGGRSYCDVEIRQSMWGEGGYYAYSRSRKVALTEVHSLREIKTKIIRGLNKAEVIDSGEVVLNGFTVAHLNWDRQYDTN